MQMQGREAGQRGGAHLEGLQGEQGAGQLDGPLHVRRGHPGHHHVLQHRLQGERALIKDLAKHAVSSGNCLKLQLLLLYESYQLISLDSRN
jgi:hypothetical protein